MDAKVDYLSFSIMEDMREGEGNNAGGERVRNILLERCPVFGGDYVDLCQWEIGGARGHYGCSVFSPDSFAAVRWGGSANHILVEMPGTACQLARDKGLLSGIISSVTERCTRLDIAVDIVTAHSPGDFVSWGYNERFKSRAEIVSADGETEYVGSMKSERYARVYKYNSPHPRAGTLRVEHVFRSEYAKVAAQLVGKSGVLALSAMCGNTWGWRSPDWSPEAVTDGKIKAQRSDRHEPARIRWLHNVCIPALVKAHKQGLLDLRSIVPLMLEQLV